MSRAGCTTVLIASAVLLMAVCVVCAEEESDVVVLNEGNFDEYLKTKELLMVEFYAPWCGHCKRLAPEFEKAATILKDQGIVLGKVESTKETALSERFAIRGYPTIKVFINGEETDYEGARTAEAIVSYLKKRTGPAATPLSTKEEADALINSESVVVIGFFADQSSNEYDMFMNTAKALRGEFMFCETTKLAQEFEVEEVPKVVLFKSFDEGRVPYSGAWDVDALTAFIQENSFPLVSAIGPDNYRKYFNRGLPLMWLFVNPDMDNEETFKNYHDVAVMSRGKLSCVHLDGVKYAGHASQMGLNAKDLPAVSIQKVQEELSFVFEGTKEKGVDANELSEWVTLFLSGELQPSVKSQPIPEENDLPVKVVVGHSFGDLVETSTKDVLIVFYAPWCGHCKRLLPVLEELAEQMADVETLMFAKIDAQANDYPRKYKVQGYPTTYFIPALRKNNPVKYNGSRTAKDMLEFIKKHASFPIKGTGLEEEVKDEL